MVAARTRCKPLGRDDSGGRVSTYPLILHSRPSPYALPMRAGRRLEAAVAMRLGHSGAGEVRSGRAASLVRPKGYGGGRLLTAEAAQTRAIPSSNFSELWNPIFWRSHGT